jgi:hypothetical protein
MGWASGNGIFDPVARKTRELGLTEQQRTEILTVLIHEMQMHDWDTEGESLDEFQDDKAVVEAFRRNEVILECGNEGDSGGDWCERERGPRGHADGQHEDGSGIRWPVTS